MSQATFIFDDQDNGLTRNGNNLKPGIYIVPLIAGKRGDLLGISPLAMPLALSHSSEASLKQMTVFGMLELAQLHLLAASIYQREAPFEKPDSSVTGMKELGVDTPSCCSEM